MAEPKSPSELTNSTVPQSSDAATDCIDEQQHHLEPQAATQPTEQPSATLSASTSFTFHAIGYLSSCFKLKFATPRQGAITPSSRASLTLLPHVHPSALVGLSSYSHCWLLFVFHHNTNRTVPTLLHPPRLPHTAPKVGLFATRSPHRFNPIGLSLCRVVAVCVEERRLELASIDLIEGTPILDIKPFHPCDQPPLHTLDATATAATYPPWLHTPHDTLTVSTDDCVRERLVGWAADRQLERYNSSVDELCALIVEMVSFDPRPPFIRDKREGRQAVFGMRVDNVNVLYYVDDDTQHATVCDVELVDAVDGAALSADGLVDERERTKRWLERIGRTDGRRSLRLRSEQAEQKHTEQPSISQQAAVERQPTIETHSGGDG